MGVRIDEFRSIGVQAELPLYAVALSSDGQYAAVGSDAGLALYNQDGERLLRYPAAGAAAPVHLVRLPGSRLSIVLTGVRQGRLMQLSLNWNDDRLSFREEALFWAANDLNSLASAEDTIAIGHLSPAVTVLDAKGRVRWQRSPNRGNSLEGRLWKVALDAAGARLYAASAGFVTNQLAAFDAHSGDDQTPRLLNGRLTQLTVLNDDNVLLAIAEPDGAGRLIVYTPDLSAEVWSHELPEPVTALAADPQKPCVAVAVGYRGSLHLFDAASGGELARPHLLGSQINALDMAAGRYVAAATESGDLRLLRYLVVL